MPTKVPAKAKKQRVSKEEAPQRDGLTKGMQARERIISVAETLFNKQGFDGASMRDIAAAASMQPASMYYHFSSKEELLWAVWEKGGVELLNRVNDAIAPVTDPWKRMETACVAHVSGRLDWRWANQASFVTPPRAYPESIKPPAIVVRPEYTRYFVLF